MADADEDVLRTPPAGASSNDTDLSDETQDFRLLNHLNFLIDPSNTSLPKRGEKDFEPNPTLFQADVLSASRQAMHNALAHPRAHNWKHHVVAFYSPEGPVPPPQIAVPKKGMGVHPDSCVCVPATKGTLFKMMGQADRWNRLWLLPEEALFLLERGNLDIRWPSPSSGTEGEGPVDESCSGIPMSLQAAYACLLGHAGLTLERYTVFSGLKRLGYVVARAPGWDDTAKVDSKDKSREDPYTRPQQRGPGLAGIFGRMFDWLHDPLSTASTSDGPVVGCGIHRSYADIYKKLAIIPWYDPVTATDRDTLDTDTPFRVVYHVYKPLTVSKKTALPKPDFRIAVINTRETPSIPTLAQLGALLETTPSDPPHGEKMQRMLYMRLRHGYRNVVLAVVDQGVASFLRVADCAFGKEKLYVNMSGPSSQKGGRNFQGKKGGKNFQGKKGGKSVQGKRP